MQLMQKWYIFDWVYIHELQNIYFRHLGELPRHPLLLVISRLPQHRADIAARRRHEGIDLFRGLAGPLPHVLLLERQELTDAEL